MKCLLFFTSAQIAQGESNCRAAQEPMSKLPDLAMDGEHQIMIAVTPDPATHTWFCAKCGATARLRPTGFKKACQRRPTTSNNINDINAKGHLPGQKGIQVDTTLRVEVHDLLLHSA